MINSILNYTYMQNALFASILASTICGLMGTIIVEKKLVSMSGGIAHASFGGIGAGYLLNIEPIIGALVFSIISSISVGQIKRKTNAAQDAIIGIFWAGGMALGILFISVSKGYPPDMTSYLFGDILTVSRFYLHVIFFLTLFVTISIISIFNYWKIYLFDEEYAKIIGLNTLKMEILLYTLTAFSIVILIRVVGIILSIAMLTIPVSISKHYFYELKHIMICSLILGIIFSFLGLLISYYLNIPSGASIILVSVLFYFSSILIKNAFDVTKRSKYSIKQ